MPAVITHYLFGRTLYERSDAAVFPTREAFEAFMLGNQGPDVLFFCPTELKTTGWSLGTQMHKTDAQRILGCMRDAANMLPDSMANIGGAYVRGLYCHFLLDSQMHPFIYAQQEAIVGAGVEGLSATDGHEVHAEIESELDILALSQIDGVTIAAFDTTLALEASPQVVHVISLMYKYVAKCALGRDIRSDAYGAGVDGYRLVLMALHSPRGLKRGVIGLAERLFRKHSMARAMSHRNRLLSESIFDNHEHAPWVHPGTGEVRTDGFWDIYHRAQARAHLDMPHMADDDFSLALAAGTDFDGNPTYVRILSVE